MSAIFPRLTIGDIAAVASGSTPARAQAGRYFNDSGQEWVKTGDLNNSLVEPTAERITAAAISETNCRVFPVGTVLVAMYGGFRQIGRTGLLTRPAAVNQAISAIQVDREKVVPEYLLHYLNFAEKLWRQFAASSRKDPNITRKDVAEFPVALPPLCEQRKIAEILRTWDDAITKATDLVTGLRTQYLRVSTTLLTPPEPILRHLSETTRPLTKRNQGEMARSKVMGVSNRDGLVPMRVQTIAEDISRYLVLPPKAFAYNPMRINVGSIAMSQKVGNVLVSPDYVLFECLSGELLPEFLGHSLKTRWWRHHVNAGGSGSVRTRTYYNDLAAISIHTPPIADQALIAQALNGAEAEIGLVEKKIDLLRTQKRGLMQKLLTGDVRVNVELDQDSGRDQQ